MHFLVKIQENSRYKQTTNKVPLMFLDVEVLSQKNYLRFYFLSTKKQRTVYVFSIYKRKNNQKERSILTRKLKTNNKDVFRG